MHDHLSRLTVLALLLIILMTCSIAFLDEGEAQTSCCFQNTCDVFPDNGPEDKLCSSLRCNGSNNTCQTWFGRQGCEHVPSICGPGSFVDVRMACKPDNKRATWVTSAREPG